MVKNMASEPTTGFPQREVRSSKGIQSIEVGYRVLQALEEAPGGALSLTGIAQASGMAPSKCHFYLTSFMRVGLVAQDGTGGLYSLGPSALRLGLAALAQVDALKAAREVMYEIRDELGHTVLLSVWGNRGPAIVYRVEGRHWSPLSVRVGTVLPMFSGTGMAQLAWLGDEVARELLASEFASLPPSDPWRLSSVDELLATLAQIRKDGFALGRGNIFPGYEGIAVPVFEHDGSVCASITVIGAANEFDRSRSGRNAEVVRGISDRVARRIGGAPARRPPVNA